MRTIKELDELAETPFIQIQAEQVRKRLFEKQVDRLTSQLNFSHNDAMHLTLIQMSILFTIATFEKSETDCENSRLKDDLSALSKKLIPDGVSDEMRNEFAEPEYPRVEWFAVLLAVILAVVCALWKGGMLN